MGFLFSGTHCRGTADNELIMYVYIFFGVQYIIWARTEIFNLCFISNIVFSFFLKNVFMLLKLLFLMKIIVICYCYSSSFSSYYITIIIINIIIIVIIIIINISIITILLSFLCYDYNILFFLHFLSLNGWYHYSFSGITFFFYFILSAKMWKMG